jgi:hypothetical protein
MISSRSFSLARLVLVLSLPFLKLSLLGQTTVEGKVMNSKNGAVGGVDVALYVVGNKDPIVSQTSDPKTGEYRFPNLHLSGAFDIVYTHAQYDTAVVSRLADQENQHVSKIIYMKGEPRPVTAVQEQFLSARRIVFLANGLESKNDKQVFVDRFTRMGIWAALDQNVEKLSSERLSEPMRKFLETDRQQTMALRDLVR